MSDDSRLTIGGNMPPADPHPERLVDIAVLPALLAREYDPLRQRAAEFEKGIARWMAAHVTEGTQPAIQDDADLRATADMMTQLADFAGGRSPASGEVNEAREKVKRAPFDACKIIDAFFNDIRATIRRHMEVVDNASAAYLRKKEERARRERQMAAEEERQRAEAAYAAAEEYPTDTARVLEAIDADQAAERAAVVAAAPTRDAAKLTSIGGVTTSLRMNWSYRVVDLLALVRAVAAGKAPVDFLSPNASVIGAAIRGKDGRRECPGLEIFDDASLRRTGRTSR